MSYILLCYSLLSPFTLFFLFWPRGPCFASFKNLVAVEFCSQSNELIHHGLADIKDAHSAIYWLIEHQLSLLHGDRNEGFIEYRAMLEVWSCCALKFLLY